MEKSNKQTKVKNYLCLGNFKICKPEKWDPNKITLEIKDYDFDSTKIDLNELKQLHKYIGEILDAYS